MRYFLMKNKLTLSELNRKLKLRALEIAIDQRMQRDNSSYQDAKEQIEKVWQNKSSFAPTNNDLEVISNTRSTKGRNKGIRGPKKAASTRIIP